jgi:DNA-binding IclR family transcriptional regulator
MIPCMKKLGKVYAVPALERAFDILDLIRSSGYGRTATELSQLLELPYSTTFYLLKTMEKHGFLRREGSNKKFHLGNKWMSYQGSSSQSTDMQLRDACARKLDQLVDLFGLTAHTAIRDGDEAVYIDRREPPNSYIKLNTWIGQRIPLHCTAVGKSLLLLSEPAEVARILHSAHLTRHTERTITDVAALIKHLQNSRKIGYTLDDREAELEGVCVAAPIVNSGKKVLAAVGVSATIYQLPPPKMLEVGEQLRKLGQEVSRIMGFHGRVPVHQMSNNSLIADLKSLPEKSTKSPVGHESS